jgi:phosphopantothenoylcysteine decarboxylase / phosphopantothenate---cysteine ligase
VRVRSASDMRREVLARADAVDIVVMAAAVADYEPVDRAAQKVSKTGDTITLALKKTPDILEELGRRRAARGGGADDRPILVGFAAETEHVVERASAKRDRKRVDIVVANDVSRADAGFEVETNEVTIVGSGGAEPRPMQTKARVAADILDRVEKLLAARPAEAR